MWDWILSIISPLVSPDWGELVGLIPLAVGGIVALYLLFLLRRVATVPPSRIRPLAGPGAPDGIHMPGPSLAPFLAATGAALFFVALVFASNPLVGIPAVAAGIVALVGALLYWGREATREYDHLEPRRALAAGPQAGPPPGVHVPGPSFRPLVISIAFTVLLLGLVIHVAIALGGLVMVVIAMLGWLRDARLEYRETVRADATGHLQNIADPRFPVVTLVTFGLILALTSLAAAGIFPPRQAAGGGTAAATSRPSAAPAASAAPASPAGSAAPGAPTAVPGAGDAAAATLEISAAGIQFDKTELTAPADKPFAIVFANNDAGIPHNVAIHQGTPTGPEIWKGDLFNGVEARTYQVPALAAGVYGFVCTVHPNMVGTLTVE